MSYTALDFLGIHEGDIEHGVNIFEKCAEMFDIDIDELADEARDYINDALRSGNISIDDLESVILNAWASETQYMIEEISDESIETETYINGYDTDIFINGKTPSKNTIKKKECEYKDLDDLTYITENSTVIIDNENGTYSWLSVNIDNDYNDTCPVGKYHYDENGFAVFNVDEYIINAGDFYDYINNNNLDISTDNGFEEAINDFELNFIGDKDEDDFYYINESGLDDYESLYDWIEDNYRGTIIESLSELKESLNKNKEIDKEPSDKVKENKVNKIKRIGDTNEYRIN